jgi:hypothetical protein
VEKERIENLFLSIYDLKMVWILGARNALKKKVRLGIIYIRQHQKNHHVVQFVKNYQNNLKLHINGILIMILMINI